MAMAKLTISCVANPAYCSSKLLRLSLRIVNRLRLPVAEYLERQYLKQTEMFRLKLF